MTAIECAWCDGTGRSERIDWNDLPLECPHCDGDGFRVRCQACGAPPDTCTERAGHADWICCGKCDHSPPLDACETCWGEGEHPDPNGRLSSVQCDDCGGTG